MPDDKDAGKEVRKQAAKQVRNQAVKAASAAGRDWAGLSKEERRPFLQEARKTRNKRANRAKTLKSLREAAEQAGHKWSELSKEQRQAVRKLVVSEKKAARKASKAQKA